MRDAVNVPESLRISYRPIVGVSTKPWAVFTTYHLLGDVTSSNVELCLSNDHPRRTARPRRPSASLRALACSSASWTAEHEERQDLFGHGSLTGHTVIEQ